MHRPPTYQPPAIPCTRSAEAAGLLADHAADGISLEWLLDRAPAAQRSAS